MGFTFTEIDHVQLAAPAGSEAVARAFFCHLLRFKEIEKPEPLRKRGGVWFASAQIQIHIGIEEPFSPAKKAHPALIVNHLEDLMRHLKKHNVPYCQDDLLPGAKRIYIHDPFGNRLELLEWIG